MAESAGLHTIRKHISQANSELSAICNYLWEIVSKPLHHLQNDADGTENGRVHVEAVEHNIWRLITETNTLSEFNIKELFLLSVAACCHDLGKALRKYGTGSFPSTFNHGISSADFLEKNGDFLGFIKDKHLGQDASKIIEIHDLNGDRFAKEVRQLKRDGRATSSGTIRHRLLAVLLKAADTLHTDASRTQWLAVNLSGLTDLQKSKYLARSCIAGWSRDGSRLTIQAMVKTEEEKDAIAACKDFMLSSEWPVVSEFLENYGFPHILEFDIEDLSNGGQQPVPAKDDEPPADDIPAGPDRFLAMKVTGAALKTALKHMERSPLCRHLASTPASGAAVVSLSVLLMRDKLQAFRNTFKNTLSEMFRESEYTPRRLAEHIGWVADQAVLLSRILDDGPYSCSGDSAEKVLKEVLEDLPNVSELIYEPLRRIHRSLRQHTHEMYAVYKTIIEEFKATHPTAEQVVQRMKSNACEDKVRSLMRAKGAALFALHHDIDAIAEAANEMSDLIIRDWDKGVGQV